MSSQVEPYNPTPVSHIQASSKPNLSLQAFILQPHPSILFVVKKKFSCYLDFEVIQGSLYSFLFDWRIRLTYSARRFPF